MTVIGSDALRSLTEDAGCHPFTCCCLLRRLSVAVADHLVQGCLFTVFFKGRG